MPTKIKHNKIITNNSSTNFKNYRLPYYLLPKYHQYILHKNDTIPDLKDIEFKLNKNTFTNEFSSLKKLNNKYQENTNKFIELENRIGDKSKKLLEEYIDNLSFYNFTKNNKIGPWVNTKYNIPYKGWTNAWRKMYEMAFKMKLIKNTNTDSKDNNDNENNTFRHFDICGYPGAFIFAINHYIKTHTNYKNYEWYVQSYNSNLEQTGSGNEKKKKNKTTQNKKKQNKIKQNKTTKTTISKTKKKENKKTQTNTSRTKKKTTYRLELTGKKDIQKTKIKKDDVERKLKYNYLLDTYGLQKKYPDRFLFGSGKTKFSGDITDVRNILEYNEFFKNKKNNLVTSDCGLAIQFKDDYSRELQMSKIHFGQLICGLMTLKKGGHFVMKNYRQFTPFSVSMIYLMTMVFKKTYLVKPESSRQHGNEIYLVGEDFYDNLSEKHYQQLLNCLTTYQNNILSDTEQLIIQSKDIKIPILNNIIQIINMYFSKLLLYKNNIYNEINKNLIIHLEYPNIFKDKLKFLNKSTSMQIKKYFTYYFNKIKYKKINNNDNLIYKK